MFVLYDREINPEQKVPIKVWLDKPEDIEPSCLSQAKNLSMLPFAKFVGLMPDCHMGYGMPIGGVLATDGVIIPNAVGVDIGCGMVAVKTSLEHLTQEELKIIMGEIRQQIPLGFEHHKERQEIAPLLFGYPGIDSETYPIVFSQLSRAAYQLGTLGGGNHFIEIQKGDDGNIWIMIHSGSRNVGKQVCDAYNKMAKEFNQEWFTEIKKEWDLAFLPGETLQGKAYIGEMNFCLDFAQRNRDLMMDRVENILRSSFNVQRLQTINIHHNYATIESYRGKNLWIHRKGATSARSGQLGIIPGSQGTSSYIVEGLGNEESVRSCSHGAGRKMGRGQAIKTLNLEEEKKRMDDMGIVHSVRNQQDLDEAPGAYKDIDAVMENQKDLVKILVKLKPLAVIKA